MSASSSPSSVPDFYDPQLPSFHALLHSSHSVLLITGAGLSASPPTCLPTFQGSPLWRRYSVTALSTPKAFNDNPRLLWEYYEERRQSALVAQVNGGHRAIKRFVEKFETRGGEGRRKAWVVNMNIDGMFDRADGGGDGGGEVGGEAMKDRLLNVHGSLFDLKCTRVPGQCDYRERGNYTYPLLASTLATSQAEQQQRKPRPVDKFPQPIPFAPGDKAGLPTCPVCGPSVLLRPDITFFGDCLRAEHIKVLEEEIFENKIDLVLVIGTSSTVDPARSYIERARNMGAEVAVVNLAGREEVEGEGRGNVEADWWFQGDAAGWLETLLRLEGGNSHENEEGVKTELKKGEGQT